MVAIDRATVADASVISDLIGEIEEYYGGDGTPGDLDQVHAVLSGELGIVVLLARDDAEVLGMVSYSFLWPAAGAETSLYLKELYVRAGSRRRGVGRALMEAVREAAITAGCSRVEWTADISNPSALAFYSALGAQPRGGKVHYRVDECR